MDRLVTVATIAQIFVGVAVFVAAALGTGVTRLSRLAALRA